MLAIIGGTRMHALYTQGARELTVETPYGSATVFVHENDQKFAFLPRHGIGGETLAHNVNYRANIWGLRSIGVSHVIAGATVGGIDLTLKNGDFLVPDQILDFTHSRSVSFEDEDERHFDFTNPFTPDCRQLLLDCASATSLSVRDGGTYVCAQGPRFETPAEIKFYRQIGGNIVGMTLMPEAALARQIELPYAAFNLVVNPAAGVVDEEIDLHETHDVGEAHEKALVSWLYELIGRFQ